jgi:phage-related protein
MPGVSRVSVRVVPDTKGFEQTVKKFLTRLEKTVQLTVNLDVDTSPARRAVDEFAERVKRDGLLLNVDADTGKAQHDIDEVSKKRHVTVNADADVGKALVKLAHLTRSRTVNIGVRLDSFSMAKVTGQLAGLSGFRSVTNGVNRVNEIIQNLDQSLPKIAAISLAVANIGAAALSSVGGLITVGASLAKIGGLSLALPGILAGAAVSVGVLGIALSDSAKQLSSLAPVWTEIKQIVRDNFWDNAKQPILDLVNNTFPQLKGALKSTASELGSWSASVAKSFERAFSGDALTEMFANLDKAISIASGSTDEFGQSIATLGKVGSSYLPRLASWVSDITVKFNNWLNEAASDGRLTGFIDAGIAALKDLGNTLSSIGSIFSGVFKAAEAAGGGGLSTLATVLGKVADIVNSPAFQTTLTTLFQGATLGVKGLAKALGPIGEMFSSISNTMSGVFASAGETVGTILGEIADAISTPAFKNGLTAFFKGIETGLLAIGPALPSLAEAFGKLAEFAGTLAAQLGPVLGTAITTLAPVFVKLLDALTPLIPTLGEALIDALTKLAPSFIDLVKAITPILPQIVTLVTDSLPGLVQSIIILTPFLVGLFGAIKSILDPLVQLGNFFVEAQGALTGTMDPVQLLTDALNGKFGPGIQFVAGLIKNMVGVVQDLGRNFGNMARDVANAVGNVESTVSGIEGAVKGAVSGAAHWLIGVGQDIIGGLIDGIKGAIGGVKDVLSGLTSLIPSWKGPESLDKVLLKPAGQSIIQGLIDGFNVKIPDVKQTLNALTSGIARVPSVPSVSAAAGAAGAGGSTFNIYEATNADLVAQRVNHYQANLAV